MYRTCAVMLATAALVVAGCGGGKKDSSSSATSTSAQTPANSVTKAQYIAKAKTICRQTRTAQKPFTKQIAALPAKAGVKQIAPLLAGKLKESRKGLARLHAIGTPTTDKARLVAYYTAAKKLADAQGALSDAAAKGDVATAQKMAKQNEPLFALEQRLADKFGINACDNLL